MQTQLCLLAVHGEAASCSQGRRDNYIVCINIQIRVIIRAAGPPLPTPRLYRQSRDSVLIRTAQVLQRRQRRTKGRICTSSPRLHLEALDHFGWEGGREDYVDSMPVLSLSDVVLIIT